MENDSIVEDIDLEEISAIVAEIEFDVLSVQLEEVPSTSGQVLENSQECQCVSDEMYARNPFILKYLFGHNPLILPTNFTINNENIVIVHGSGHIVTIYNHKTKYEQNLIGHDCTLFNYASDKSTRFLASCDYNSTIIIWDIFFQPHPIPIFTIYESHPNDQIGAMNISADAKYLATANLNPEITVKFWLWTYGLETPHDEKSIPLRYGEVKSLNFSFNENENEYFALTCANGVVFGTWNKELSKLDLHYPKNVKLRDLNRSIYIQESRQVLTITYSGKVIVWSDVIVESPNIPITNKKEFLKCLQLRPVSINYIDNADNVIVIGDDLGDIRFYDIDLKLLYWYEGKNIGPISFINFHRVPRKYKIEDAVSYSPRENESTEILFKQLLPRDATMEKNPFIIRNFIVGTKTGKIGLVNPLTHTYRDILYESENLLTTFCIHPYKTIYCAANKSSRIFQIDYKTKKTLRDNRLPRCGDVNRITTLLFSKSGNYLVCGMQNGELWFLDPFLLTPSQSYLRLTTSEIILLCFIDELNVVYTDSENTVVLVHLDGYWHFVGKFHYHTKPIVALLPFSMNDDDFFLTVGEDRAIVKYSVKQSLENMNLTIVKSERIDQFAIPKSAILIPFNEIEFDQVSTELVILVADDTFKLKLYDLNNFQHLKTLNLQKSDYPISNMIFFKSKTSNDSFLIVTAGKLICLILLPYDGNPYRYLGMIGHSIMINFIYISEDLELILVLGDSSYTVITWQINKDLIKQNVARGGKGLLPFVSILPGQRDGWLFKEMQDMFYYIQIMCEGMDSPMERIVKNYIQLPEIADYMRGIGFFPTDYEINNMSNELIRRYRKKNIKVTNVSFEDLVKFYINYRPVKQITISEIEKAVDYFSYKSPSEVNLNELGENTGRVIFRDKIMDIMTKLGEPVSEIQAAIYLRELLSKTDDTEKEVTKSDTIDKILKNIPEAYTIENFLVKIIGVSFENGVPVYSGNVDPSKINKQLNNELKFNIPVEERIFDELEETDSNEEVEGDAEGECEAEGEAEAEAEAEAEYD